MKNSGPRTEPCESLFRQIVRDESHVLHYLLPAKRDSLFTDRMRSAKTFPLLHTRTTRLQKFIFAVCANQFSVGLARFNFLCMHV